MCKLCDLIKINGHEQEITYQDDNFVMVSCLSCHVPMLVFKYHSDFLPADFYRYIEHLMTEHAPVENIDEWFIDYKMSKIPEHWHCHLRERSPKK